MIKEALSCAFRTLGRDVLGGLSCQSGFPESGEFGLKSTQSREVSQEESFPLNFSKVLIHALGRLSGVLMVAGVNGCDRALDGVFARCEQLIQKIEIPLREQLLTCALAGKGTEPIVFSDSNLQILKEILAAFQGFQGKLSFSSENERLLALVRSMDHLIQSVEMVSGRYVEMSRDWKGAVEKMGFTYETPEEAVNRVPSNVGVYSNLNATGPVNTTRALVERVKRELAKDNEQGTDTAVRGLTHTHMAVITPKESCGLCHSASGIPKENYEQLPIFRTRACTNGDVKARPRDTFYTDLGVQLRGMENGEYPFRVAIIQIPRPVVKEDGCVMINFGPDVGANPSVIAGILKTGGRIIFEVNEALPYAAGEELDLKKLQGKKESLSAVHVSFVIGVNNLDMMIPGEKTLTKNGKKSSKAQMQEAIARHVANLIQDGDTVQCGIGEIPAEVLKHLRDAHTNVDIYTEVIADGIIDYFDPETEGGRMNMERFIREGRKVVLGFAVGSRRLIEFVGRYPQLFEFRRSLHVNAPANVAAIPNFKAVNGATEVTMGGQVMAFTVNGSALSGIGGQGDMATGALGGHTRRPNDTSASIIVLPSMRQETFVYDSAEVIPEDRYVVPPGESDLRLYYRPQKNNNPVAIPDGKVKVKVWVSKVVLGPGLDATTQRMGQLAHLVTENGVTPRLHHLSVGHRICEIIKLAHPAFKKGLVEGAQAQGWLSNIDLDQEIPGWNTWEEGE